MKIGFIGLGNLGGTIANRLIEQGEELVLYNRTKGKADNINAKEADSLQELIAEVDIAFMCLFDSPAVEQTLNELCKHNLDGKIIIDLTTNHFDYPESFYKMLKEKNASYLESPVLGSVAPAKAGALTILVSSDEEPYKKTLPLLEKIGANIFYLKEITLATKMKVINNLSLGSFMATIAECLSLAEKSGLEKNKVLDILAVGGANSMVLNAKKEKLSKEDFTPHFSNKAIYKDLHTLEDLAYKLKTPIYTSKLPKELFAKTFEKNEENLDFSSIYNILK